VNTRTPQDDLPIQITRLESLEDIHNSTLRSRARRAHASVSNEFIAYAASEEAGFVTFDHWNRQSLGFVQEIFVLPEFRRLRIATRLLAFSESLALHLGCRCVRLKPYSLDEDTDQIKLEDWYRRVGYRRSLVDQETVEKILSVTP
jgi:GNAT superfamily N-acetyltransferase